MAVVLDGKVVLPFVGQQVLEVTSIKEFDHFESKSNAIKSCMTMVNVELTPRGDVSLGVLIIGLLGPSNSVNHTFHDGYYFHELNIEVLL